MTDVDEAISALRLELSTEAISSDGGRIASKQAPKEDVAETQVIIAVGYNLDLYCVEAFLLMSHIVLHTREHACVVILGANGIIMLLYNESLCLLYKGFNIQPIWV